MGLRIEGQQAQNKGAGRGVGRREQAEEGVAGRKEWYGIANRRASKHRIRGQAMGVGRRELAEEGVAGRKG